MIFLIAAMLYLINDSPKDKTAIIIGADGTELGHAVINEGQTYTWTDTVNYYNKAFGKGSLSREAMTKSEVPYTVKWYCTNGNFYGYKNKLVSGTTIFAKKSTGPKICHPEKHMPGPYPNQPEGQQLYKPQPPFEIEVKPPPQQSAPSE